MYKGQIPFDSEGLAHYPGSGVGWKDNFQAIYTLTFEGFRRGRSAAYALMTCNGINYSMFLKDLGEMLTKTTVHEGKVTGTFEFCKRGTNYGIRWSDVQLESQFND